MYERQRHFYSAIIDRLGWYEGLAAYYHNACRALGEFFPEILDLIECRYQFRHQIDLMVEKVLTLRAATINRFYLLTEAEYGEKTLVVTVTAKGLDSNGFVLIETYGTVSFEIRREEYENERSGG